MNTTKKGDKLEDRAFVEFNNQIAEERFFSRREYCKIFQKKGYYSRDRKKDIIFDIAVEVTLPGQERYSLLFLIECKNYSHRVPVDDVEEFFAKIQQVSGANVKGIVMSTNSFQQGAFNFAKSKGIGLLRYFKEEELEWILARSPSNMVSTTYATSASSSAYKALWEEDYKSRYFDFYGFVDETYTVSSNQFFSSLSRVGTDSDILDSLAEIEQATRKTRLAVPYKKMEEIERVSSLILSEIGYRFGQVPLDKICEFLNEKFGLVIVRNINLDEGILGQISFGPDEIFIDDYQASTPERARFTLAHELGHFLLDHKEFIARETCHEEDIDLERSENMNLRDVKRMEWQANIFASYLLLPTEQFRNEFLKQATLHELFDRGYGLLYLDDQRCNIGTFCSITSSLMKNFQVSRSVVKIRLLKLGFLKESQDIPKQDFLSTQSMSRPIG